MLVAATVRNPETFEVFLKELGKYPSLPLPPAFSNVIWANSVVEGHSLAWASELWIPHEPRILYYPTTTPIRILKITCPMAAIAAT